MVSRSFSLRQPVPPIWHGFSLEAMLSDGRRSWEMRQDDEVLNEVKVWWTLICLPMVFCCCEASFVEICCCCCCCCCSDVLFVEIVYNTCVIYHEFICSSICITHGRKKHVRNLWRYFARQSWSPSQRLACGDQVIKPKGQVRWCRARKWCRLRWNGKETHRDKVKDDWRVLESCIRRDFEI